MAKIVIIGGGSINWVPKIATDLMLTKELGGSTLVLEDINLESLTLTTTACQKIAKKWSVNWKIESTTDQIRAIEDADFIILTISVGGDPAWKNDVDIPVKYGIYQSVGDTTGPGGLSRALRHIPVVVHLARNMEKYASNAWLINYTNPMTTITRAVNKVTSIKIIGLCHELFGIIDWLKDILQVKEKEIRVIVAGINHFIWILKMSIGGKDGFRLLRDFISRKSIYYEKDKGPGYYLHALNLFLFDLYGYLPAAGDRHIAEFLPYFLTEEAKRGEKFLINWQDTELYGSTRADQYKEFSEMMKGEKPLPEKHSWEKAASIIGALISGENEEDIINLPNKGQIENLPSEAVIESMAIVGANGVRPITLGKIPSQLQQLIYPHILRQEMVVDAALKADKKLALQALISDPLVQRYDIAEKMLDELLKANSQYLSQWKS